MVEELTKELAAKGPIYPYEIVSDPDDPTHLWVRYVEPVPYFVVRFTCDPARAATLSKSDAE
jgi:hypothetical protein